MWLDDEILRGIAAIRPGWLTSLVRGVMFAGTSHITLGIVGLGVLGLILRFRSWRLLIAMGASTVLASEAGNWLKELFDRPRPPILYVVTGVPGPAFPSTHAARAAALSVAFILVAKYPSAWAQKVTERLFLWGNVLLGLMLVYLGAHWFTDVLAGWLLGAAFGAMIGLLLSDDRWGTQ